MGLGDVAGVFSRYFIVGFLLPSFFVLIVLSQLVSDAFLPNVYLEAGSAARVLVVGGTALLVGLVLLGLHYQVLRLLEGYPLVQRRDRWYARRAYTALQSRQLKRFKEAEGRCKSPTATDAERRNAKWRLDLEFPHDRESLILPTRLGNAIRAFERHPHTRWGLNGIAAWPRIEMLLSAEETQVHADAKGDMSFFVNATVLLPLAGVLLIADAVANEAAGAWYTLPLYLVPFVLAVSAYTAAVGAAINWGSAVRSSFDVHRLELYEKIGLRSPESFSEEKTVLAPALSAALLRAEAIPDELAADTSQQPDAEPSELSLGPLVLRVDTKSKGAP